MRVTVLGCGAAYPRPGGACTGYLVEGGGVRVWVDAGNGTLSNLLRLCSHRDVDALVLSHRHADHIADVTPFMYALGFDAGVTKPVAVYALPEAREVLAAPLGDTSLPMLDSAFEWRGMPASFEVGGLRVEPFETVHSVPCRGFRIRDDDAVFVFTADTAGFDGLADACRGASLLVCEASYVRETQAARGVHLWAHEAGAVAADAAAGRLVLTHIWPTIDPAVSVAEASEAYDGRVEAASEGDVYDV